MEYLDKLRELIGNYRRSGQAEAVAVADIVESAIADNPEFSGDQSQNDKMFNHTLCVLEEIIDVAKSFKKILRQDLIDRANGVKNGR